MAAQGRHSLVRNEVTQNSPDFNRPGCKLRRTHILPSGEYRSAPFVPKGLFVWYNLCNSSTFVVINIEADMVFRIICINIYFNIITMIFRHIIITDMQMLSFLICPVIVHFRFCQYAQLLHLSFLFMYFYLQSYPFLKPNRTIFRYSFR